MEEEVEGGGAVTVEEEPEEEEEIDVGRGSAGAAADAGSDGAVATSIPPSVGAWARVSDVASVLSGRAAVPGTKSSDLSVVRNSQKTIKEFIYKIILILYLWVEFVDVPCCSAPRWPPRTSATTCPTSSA